MRGRGAGGLQRKFSQRSVKAAGCEFLSVVGSKVTDEIKAGASETASLSRALSVRKNWLDFTLSAGW